MAATMAADNAPITVKEAITAHLVFPPDLADDFPMSMELNNLEPAVSLVKRENLPGAENLVFQRFQELFAQMKCKEAAELAAISLQGIIHKPNTVAKLLVAFLCNLAKFPFYYSTQNKKKLPESWLAEDKLECTEELGDPVKVILSFGL
ncbi:hypothetical protein ACLOJK_008840 [Asimina triloba]